MKRFFTITTIILLAATSNILMAQNCDFTKAGVRFNSSQIGPNGECRVNLDIYFDLQTNMGSKYVMMHVWPTGIYPGLTYINPPLSSQLAGSSTIVIHHFQDHTYSYVDTVYRPDLEIQPQYVDMHLAIGPGENPGYNRFTISNVNLEVPAGCDLPRSFTLDLWSTESEAMNAVHCSDKANVFFVNNPKVVSLFNCDQSRTFNVQILSIDPIPLTISYKVYLDNGDNIFNKTTDTIIVKSQDGIIISDGISYNSDFLPYLPYSTMPQWANMNLWVEVTSSSLSNSAIALVDNSCATLPVKLRSFDATKVGAVIRLDWVTTSEYYNKGFGIERRVGERPWEPIGFVNSKALRGCSTTEIFYSHTDHINLKEFIQYRLKQVDMDGNFEYSEIRIVRNEATNAITIFPNPTTGNVNIAFADQQMPYDVRIYNENGQLINKWHNCKATLTITNLKPGIYILKINEQFNKRVTTHRAIVLNKKG